MQKQCTCLLLGWHAVRALSSSHISTKDKSAQTRTTENISSDKNVPELAAYIGQARGLQHRCLALDGCPCKSHALMHPKHVVVGPEKQIYKESYVESKVPVCIFINCLYYFKHKTADSWYRLFCIRILLKFNVFVCCLHIWFSKFTALVMKRIWQPEHFCISFCSCIVLLGKA